MPSLRALYVWVTMLMIATPGIVLGQDLPETETDRLEVVESSPINSGFVILGGRYLAAPYVLRQQGESFWINDQLVDLAKLSNGQPGPAMGGGPGRPGGHRPGGLGDEWRRPRGEFPRFRGGLLGPRGQYHGEDIAGPQRPSRPRPSPLERVKRQLENQRLLIVLDETGRVLEEKDTLYLLNILLADDSIDAKIEKTLDWNGELFTPEQWATIVAGFEPTTELTDRVAPELEQFRQTWEDNQAAHDALMRAQVFRSKPVQYSITILAMGLAVVAVGTLLTHRPSPTGSWRDIDDAKERVTMVVRNVALLAALSGIDLFLTLVAQQGGGFLEVNPLASQMIASPLMLVAFKLTGLAVACLILVSLRRYRGAQVASWWLCLLCTIVAFRWLTYNSLFFS